MPNNPIPIAIALLLLSSTSAPGPSGLLGPHPAGPRHVSYIQTTRPSIPLGGLLGRPGVPLRIAPASIPELEDTLSGMLKALHTIDKLKNLGSVAQTLSGMGGLLQAIPQSIPQPIPQPMQGGDYNSEGAYNSPAVPSSASTAAASFPDMSKLMEIAGPVISAINSPR